MAKSKNGKAKRIYKEQAQVQAEAQAVVKEQIKLQQRKSSTRFNRWVFSLLALLFLSGAGFAVAESRAVQAARVSDQARSIDDEDVDPKTWRDLELVMTKRDGGKVKMGLLRPTWWIEQVGAEEGKSIPLSIPEMQLAGPTKVVSITDMKPGPPRGDGVVTGTFKHTSADVLDLQLQGEKKPIGVTSSHPFRSADRNDWVPVGQLKVGERVVTRNGTTKVVSLKKRPGSEPVYNLEVHGTHTYFVGSTGGGVWVHNACPYAGDPFPGVSPRQGLHSPLKAPKTPYHNFPAQNPAKTALDPADLPAGKTVQDALMDAWANPVAGGAVNPANGSFVGIPGYPLNAAGHTKMMIRVGDDGVHGWPIP